MKELSIEQKAKRYNEAIEIAKRINNEQQAQPFNIMTRVFPELKESEGEKWIPKEIAKYLKEKGGFRSCWLAWLEKQGKISPILSNSSNIGKVEQKQEWSEEDENIKESIITGLEMLKDGASDKSLIALYNKKIDWLKSLKDRVGYEVNSITTKECSEEVEAAISLLKHIAEEQEKDYCQHNANDLRKAAQYLETCRPQSQWKPSDEQILAIETAINVIGKGTLSGKQLVELQEQLKKLREE